MTSVLDRLREPFPPDQVEHRPEVNCRACVAGNCIEHELAECETCKQTITTAHTHIDYIGHAQVTRRLLEVDPTWTWQPLALHPSGLPQLDERGGLWIKLTVHECATNSRKVTAITRLGYGEPGSANGPDRVKATISDAIRNAAMRFGVALELWAGDRRDRSMVDGTPGLPSAPAGDPRAPFWELIRSLSAELGRTENRQIAEAFYDWTPDSGDGQASLASASMTDLAGYVLHLSTERDNAPAVAQ